MNTPLINNALMALAFTLLAAYFFYAERRDQKRYKAFMRRLDERTWKEEDPCHKMPFQL